MIRASEAYNDIDAIQTIIDGKRDIAFLVITTQYLIDNTGSINALQLAIKNGLNLLPIKSRNDGVAFIIYKNDKDKALKLLAIAESHEGYLINEDSQETETIGNLLEYHPRDIKNFIKRVYNKI